MKLSKLLASALLPLLLVMTGCAKKEPTPDPAAQPHKHEHHPPHGGTPVVLGEETYHVEFVRIPETGKLQAYVLDGEMENFIRSSARSIEIVASVNGKPETLTLNAVGNPATGETVGDTSLFEGQADWLKTAQDFDGTLKTISIRGSTFSDVKFNFPKGNDKD